MHRVTTLYRRDDLFKQVWAEPMRDVARRYGISDVALKKTCRRLRVPVPDAGHWNKLPDRRDPPPSLPPLPDGESSEITVHRYVPVPAEVAPLPASVQAIVNRERTPAAAIAVSGTLTSPHPLVAATKRALTKARPDAEGMLHVPHDQTGLDVRVSAPQLDRLMRIMDALVKALAARGLQVRVAGSPPTRGHELQAARDQEPSSATRVLVDGAWVTLRLVEKLRMERLVAPDQPWDWRDGPRVRYSPKGVFELTAQCGNQEARWLDRATRPLEGCLNDVVARLHVLVHRQREARVANERAELRRQEEARHRREEQERAEAEQERARRLREEVERWELARSIRGYVAEAQAIVAAGHCTLIEDGKLAQSLRWAVAYADQIDPFASLRAEVAGRVAERAASGPPAGPARPEP